nr:hypothetical protein Itr_chr01CG06560 [Ipomoea trifida]
MLPYAATRKQPNQAQVMYLSTAFASFLDASSWREWPGPTDAYFLHTLKACQAAKHHGPLYLKH